MASWHPIFSAYATICATSSVAGLVVSLYFVSRTQRIEEGRRGCDCPRCPRCGPLRCMAGPRWLNTLDRYLSAREASGKPLHGETMHKIDSGIESIRRDLDRLEGGSSGRSLGDLPKRRAKLNERKSQLRQRQKRMERK